MITREALKSMSPEDRRILAKSMARPKRCGGGDYFDCKVCGETFGVIYATADCRKRYKAGDWLCDDCNTTCHKCDRCSQWKPGPKPGTSYFTDRYWYCDDCKYEQAKERGMPEVVAVLQESRER